MQRLAGTVGRLLASVFPIAVSATAAVQNIQLVYVRAARNFGLSRLQLFRRVIFPAALPQILTGLRIALGMAWLVVVAAEMVVVNPQAGGQGHLIIDARNAGSRYDVVVAGMVLDGVIGLVRDQNSTGYLEARTRILLALESHSYIGSGGGDL